MKKIKSGISYLFKRIYKLDNKTKIVFIGLFVLVLIFPTISLSRYIYDVIKDKYYLSQNFYFYSDIMTSYTGNLDSANVDDLKQSFSYSWDGSSASADSTVILHSTKQGNSLLTTKADIEYKFDFCLTDPEMKCLKDGNGNYLKETSNLIVQLTKENPTDVITTESYKRIIKKNSLSDSFKINISKKLGSSAQYKDGDRVTIRVWAESISPYKEKIAGFITYIVKKQDVSYEISDSEHSLYSTLRLSNSQDGGATEIADITINPEYVRLDMNNRYYMDCVTDNNCTVVTGDYNVLNEDVTVDGNTYTLGSVFSDERLSELNIPSNKTSKKTYVTKFTVKIEPLYSVSINFYKHYILEDYTYNGVGENNTPIQVVFRTD